MSVGLSYICIFVLPAVSTSFQIDNKYFFRQIFLLLDKCIDLGTILLGIVNGQILISSDGIIALVSVLKVFFGLYFLYTLEYNHHHHLMFYQHAGTRASVGPLPGSMADLRPDL